MTSPDPLTPERQPPAPPSAGLPFEPDTTCDACGRFGAYRVAERAWCADCLAGAGSCCPEFGPEDPGTEPAD